jgi:hypothetical protein
MDIRGAVSERWPQPESVYGFGNDEDSDAKFE